MVEQVLLNSLVFSRALIEEKVDRYRTEAEVYRITPRLPLRTRLARLLRATAERLEPSPRKPYITLEVGR